MTLTDIARACHEVNRAFCRAIGDDSQVPWDEAPDWQKDSARNGVQFLASDLILNNGVPALGPKAAHENWLREKALAGWKYGPVKDAEKREHPCFRAYAELPPDQRTKDELFVAVVRGLYRQLDITDLELIAAPDIKRAAGDHPTHDALDFSY